MDPAFDLCKGSPSSAPGFRGPRLLDAPPPNNILKDTQHPLCSGSGPCADTERSQTSAFPSHALQVPGTSFSKGLCPYGQRGLNPHAVKLCGVSAAPVGGGFSEAPQRFGRGPWRRRRGPRPHGPRIALCCYVSHARARSRSDPSFPLTPRPEGTSPRRRRCGRGGLRCCDARAWAASCLRTRGWRHGAGETRPGLGWLGVLESARFIPTPPPPPPPSAWQGPGWCDMQTSPWRSATDQAATSAGASWVPLAGGRADGGMGAAPACTLC